MALSDLIAVLEQEATAEAEALLRQAREEARVLEAAAESRLAARRAELALAREGDRRAAVERGLAPARREGRRVVLESRRRLIERVMSRARERFAELQAGAAYQRSLAAHVAQALACLGDGPATIAAHADLVAPLRRAVHNPNVTIQPAPAGTFGFRASSGDGSVEVDATFASRLARVADWAALDVAARVDGSA